MSSYPHGLPLHETNRDLRYRRRSMLAEKVAAEEGLPFPVAMLRVVCSEGPAIVGRIACAGCGRETDDMGTGLCSDCSTCRACGRSFPVYTIPNENADFPGEPATIEPDYCRECLPDILGEEV